MYAYLESQIWIYSLLYYWRLLRMFCAFKIAQLYLLYYSKLNSNLNADIAIF